MKKATVLFWAISLVLYGCSDIETVSFKEPQPADKKALTSFPGRLKGKYISQDEVSVLTISDKYMVHVTDYEVGIRKSELDTNYTISGDSLIDKMTGHGEKIILRGDSILAHIHEEDTISNMAAGDVLKKFKGYYFLNKGNNQDGWQVTRLTLNSGKLVTSYITDSTAFNKLNELAEKPLDTVTQQYSISKRKFKVLLKSRAFSDHDTFTKIR